MRHGDSKSSWTMVGDISCSLNFAIYVGNALRITPECQSNESLNILPENAYDLSFDEREEMKIAWSQWWDRLIETKMNSRLTESEKDLSLVSDPHLRTICDELWEVYVKWFYMPIGCQVAMFHYARFDGVRGMVNEFEKEYKCEIQPFRMYAEFVYGGLREPQEVRSNYFIVPISFAPNRNKEWWRQKVYSFGWAIT